MARATRRGMDDVDVAGEGTFTVRTTSKTNSAFDRENERNFRPEQFSLSDVSFLKTLHNMPSYTRLRPTFTKSVHNFALVP